MASPKTIVQALNDYFDVIERLALKSKSVVSMPKNDVFQEIVAVCNQDREKALDVFVKLTKKGILRTIDQGDSYLIQKYTKDYVLNLVQEQKLGLADIVKVEIDRVGKLSEEIQFALDKKEIGIIESKAAKIIDLMDDIQGNLESNSSAIKNIIERAKMLPADTPFNIRYGEVAECFEQYVNPMTQFLGNDSSGFQNMTLTVEKQLEEGIRLSEIQTGALSSWSRTMRSAIGQIRTLRAQIRANLRLFQDDLAPLRIQLVKNNEISRSVVTILSRIRKKKKLSKVLNVDRLRLGGNQRDVRMSFGPEIREYAAKVLDYVPSKVAFPEAMDALAEDLDLLRLDDVIENLVEYDGKINLMQWLYWRYPKQTDKQLLTIYHQLLEKVPERFHQMEIEETMELKEYKITYYPHTLEVPNEFGK